MPPLHCLKKIVKVVIKTLQKKLLPLNCGSPRISIFVAAVTMTLQEHTIWTVSLLVVQCRRRQSQVDWKRQAISTDSVSIELSNGAHIVI